MVVLITTPELSIINLRSCAVFVSAMSVSVKDGSVG